MPAQTKTRKRPSRAVPQYPISCEQAAKLLGKNVCSIHRAFKRLGIVPRKIGRSWLVESAEQLKLLADEIHAGVGNPQWREGATAV